MVTAGGEENVLGYNLLNEPWAGDVFKVNWKVWSRIYFILFPEVAVNERKFD